MLSSMLASPLPPFFLDTYSLSFVITIIIIITILIILIIIIIIIITEIVLLKRASYYVFHSLPLSFAIFLIPKRFFSLSVINLKSSEKLFISFEVWNDFGVGLLYYVSKQFRQLQQRNISSILCISVVFFLSFFFFYSFYFWSSYK